MDPQTDSSQMKKTSHRLASVALGVALLSEAHAADFQYGRDVQFLAQHVQVIELAAKDGRARIAVVPAYQGRVMTSTADGEAGFSFGFLNREQIASGKVQPHINVYGGEDRLWLGPEGGPYSLFFAHNAPEQTLQYWQTPAFVDTMPWEVESRSATEVAFVATADLANRAGTALHVAVRRRVRLLDSAAATPMLGVAIPADVRWVGYQTENRLTNRGTQAWAPAGGMPSIWILGMFKHGPATTIVIPLVGGTESEMGRPVRSDYFGPIPPDRLKVTRAAVFFRADGQARGKIGVPPLRAKSILGSWDAERGVLTIVHFNLPKDAAQLPYVDSRWLDMSEPYAGDVVNAYNDGPPTPGAKPLGPFYELETSSPAAALAPGASIEHVSSTFHFTGSRAELDSLAQRLLGVSLDEIEHAWP